MKRGAGAGPGGAAVRFPPGKSGGLIEAISADAGVSPPSGEFPPGKSGGLIEASALPARSRPPVTLGFRRVNPAASLKQQ